MRVEPFTAEDFVHVYNRGNRQMPIVNNETDNWRFLKILRYFNSNYYPKNIFRTIDPLIKSGDLKLFQWPKNWPEQNPLVKIIAYCLMPNHFHLLLKEIIKGRISKFMQRFGTAFTRYIDIKYDEVGRVFQGAYKGKTIKGEAENLHYLDVYIQVFNPMELYPGGIEKALKEFDQAFEFVLNYPFSSLGESFGKRKMGIIDRDILGEVFPDLKIYKEFTHDALIVRNIREILGKLIIE